jgi:hypothetical protein
MIESLEGRALLAVSPDLFGPNGLVYKGTGAVPGAIHAENYDRGGTKIGYLDSTKGNAGKAYRPAEHVDILAKASGGYAVAWTVPGEWLQYTVSAEAAGVYTVTFRVGSAGTGGTFHVNVNQFRRASNVEVPYTGPGDTWTEVTAQVPLNQGKNFVRLVMAKAGSKGQVGKFDWMKFALPAPEAPTDLSASVLAETSISLKWTDNSQRESGYFVERAASEAGPFTQIAKLAKDATTYTDSGIPSGGTYHYRVRAFNSGGRSAFSNVASETTEFGGPITITTGGVYTGRWLSPDADTPAVRILTSEPVFILDSVLSGPGNLIEAIGVDADLTVRNTSGFGVMPDEAWRHVGRFVDVDDFKNVVIEHNYLEQTAGIYLADYDGLATPGGNVTIRFNSAKNIEGRVRDGAGNLVAGDEDKQFVQFNRVHNISSAVIAWNQVINVAGESEVEDVISIHESSGTSASPILIHNNYIKGAYPADPYSDDFSGGGIMLSDGGSNYVRAYNNQVIDTTNYGLAISSGHDNLFYNNRVLSLGTLPDGTPTPAQNVGAYIWDVNNSGAGEFFNNSGTGNQVGWLRFGERNDWWVPDATAWTGNTAWPGNINANTVAGEWTFWLNKLAGNGFTVGVEG